ncbi:MAG: MarR family transcriptional regulator [Actinomycetales bacterium]|nr:MarR family transcriptional regulator [Actinomycetales bacterium]
MHSTDLTAMGIISDAARDGAELTPSQLAAELHLSASAVTSLVSRLEHIGHVRRLPHVVDGRKVVVEITPSAADLASTSFQPLSAAIRAVLASRSDAELALVGDVLSDVVRAMTDVCDDGRGARAAGLVAPRGAATLTRRLRPPRPRSSGDRAPLS